MNPEDSLVDATRRTPIMFALLTAAAFVPAACSTPRHTAAVSAENQTILAASSPFEDLAEYALAGDSDGMTKALKRYEDLSADVEKILQQPARDDLSRMVASIKQAKASGDNETVAMDAVTAYRVLIDSLDTSALVVPKQVAQLDYAGFRLQVLLSMDSPDWSAIRATSDEAGAWWGEIDERVRDNPLRDTVAAAVKGMADAARLENAPMAKFAAQMDLDLVDLLEGYFERNVG